MIQDDFDKVHRGFIEVLMNVDKEKREKCYPLLFNLLLNYNRICIALGIEVKHNTSNNEEVK